MPIIWRLGQATVDEVRESLPKRYRSAYNTVQTVLNRLAERGLLTRERSGHAFVYRPVVSEAEYLRRSINQTLASASGEARQTVLAHLVGNLDRGELSALQDLAREIDQKRNSPRR
jgi:predicted transcriptional regulator